MKNIQNQTVKSIKTFIRKLLSLCWPSLVLVAGFYVITTFGVTLVRITGDSMKPTLQGNEWALIPKYELWLKRWGYGEYQRGELVYFRLAPGMNQSLQKRCLWKICWPYRPWLVKRIIALPDETLSITNGKIYLNDERLVESYVLTPGSFNLTETTMPLGEIFVLGDNRVPFGSIDSRQIGTISIRNISGRVGVVW